MFYRDLLLRGVLWSDKLGNTTCCILGSAMYNIFKNPEVKKSVNLNNWLNLGYYFWVILVWKILSTWLPFHLMSAFKSESAVYLSKKRFSFSFFCLNEFNFPSSSEIPAISGLNLEAFIVLYLRTSSVLQGHGLLWTFVSSLCFDFVFVVSWLGKTEEWILQISNSVCLYHHWFFLSSPHMLDTKTCSLFSLRFVLFILCCYLRPSLHDIIIYSMIITTFLPVIISQFSLTFTLYKILLHICHSFAYSNFSYFIG